MGEEGYLGPPGHAASCVLAALSLCHWGLPKEGMGLKAYVARRQ